MFSPLQIQPWDIDDFSGGMTDNYLDGRKNQYQYADNFVITDNKKLLTRGGSQVSDTTNYLPNYLLQNNRTNLIFVFEDLLWEQQLRALYYNSSGYTTLTGPTGNPALPSGISTNRTSWAYWNHHIILANDSFCTPQKLYKDGSSIFQIRTAGLPVLATAPTVTGSNALVYAFANSWKTKYNLHCADGAQHTSGVDATNPVTAANATDTASLIALVTQMLTKFTTHEADSQLGAVWLYHKAKATASRVPASVVPPTTVTECVTRLSDLLSKYNAHDNDGTAHGAAGSHQVVLTAPVVRNYIYTFCYTYTYTVGTVTFKDYGTTKIVVASAIDMPSDTNVAITAIPVIANGATENYDTTVITVEIYRTIDAGQTSYYVGAVTNGTAVYTDSSSDTTIQSNAVVYTDGGVLDNDTPPKAKFVTVANDICWYAHVKEGTQVRTNRIRQSIKFDIDSCPATFYTDVEDEITGIANISIYPIVFCKQRIYRLENFFDLTGRGTIDKFEISRVVGCTSHLGIVVTLQGLFFPGNDGFYWTDGYQVYKISTELNTTYAALQNKTNIYGAYDPIYRRVYWAVQKDSSSGDNDAFAIADLKFGISPATPFTTASGGTSFAPSAIAFFNSYLYRADKRGYLFQHLDSLQNDPKVDVLAVPTAWATKTIIYNYVSTATNFGSTSRRKWVPKLIVYAKNISNVSIGINSLNDDSVVPKALKEIRALSNVSWGDSKLVWGDATCVWNYSTLIKAERNFPARGLRCDYKQVQFTNSYTIVENSDTLGVASIDQNAKTVTLYTYPASIWPTDAVDYYISFLADAYVQDFLITARTDSVLTYSDAGNVTLTATNTKWVIRGYRKNDVLNLLNFTILFAYISDTQDKYSKTNTGANA